MSWWTWPDRPNVPEILDDPGVDDGFRVAVLQRLPAVNQWLGGWWALKWTLQEVEAAAGVDGWVLDVGCGVGDLGQRVKRWAEARGKAVEVVGVDLSVGLLQKARERTLFVVRGDAFRLPFPDRSFSVVMASLFLHHFTGRQLEAVFGELCRVAGTAIVINDLLRSRVAWALWKLYSAVFVRDPVIRYDGAVSIRKGFTPPELLDLAKRWSDFFWTAARRPGFRVVLAGIRR